MKTELQTMKELMQEKWNKRPLIISGPCSAETEEQMLETATRLAQTDCNMLRLPQICEGSQINGIPGYLRFISMGKCHIGAFLNSVLP